MMNPPSAITSMSSVERHYFQEVGNQCLPDVERLCGSDNFAIPHFPLTASPIFSDFGSLVDDMMRSVMEFPTFAETEEEASNVGMQETAASDESQERELETHEETTADNSNEPEPVVIVRTFSQGSINPCHEDLLLQHMLSQFLPVVAPEETTQLAHELAGHGRVMLHRLPEENTQVFRMARRLSEVTPEEVIEHRSKLFLPFTTDKNECLLRAYEHHSVSAPCGKAIQTLEHVRTSQYVQHVQHRQEELDTFANLFVLYFLVLATAVVLYCRRKKLFSVKRRLAASIFDTVYNSPKIKQEVERELGRSIGNAPPNRHWKVVRTHLRKIRFVTFTIFSILSILVLWDVVPVQSALQMCIIFAALLFVKTLFWTPVKIEDEDVAACACCCCAATPEDAEAGLLTEAQACCACCKGTGVCAPECASCCPQPGDYKLMEDDMEMNRDKSGCCGGGGCCCCGGNSSPDKKSSGSCCGDGCCCGSNSSPDKKSSGSCCGDGCCSGSVGCCCCGGNSSPDKKTLKPRVQVHAGVPIQIV